MYILYIYVYVLLSLIIISISTIGCIFLLYTSQLLSKNQQGYPSPLASISPGLEAPSSLLRYERLPQCQSPPSSSTWRERLTVMKNGDIIWV